MAKPGCKRIELYSQRDQVGREDPHSLSDHGHPAEESKKQGFRTTMHLFCCEGKHIFPPRRRLSVIKQAQRDAAKKPLAGPRSGDAGASGGTGLFTENDP